MENKANWMTEHWRARRNFGIKKGVCSVCTEKKKTEIHHINEDWHDNRKENLAEICRSCHTKTHRKRPNCKVENCGQLHRRNGYCEKHSQRFKKYGNPLAFKRNQHSPIVYVD